MDDKDRIYIVDQYNHRVQVFQYLSNKPKPNFAKQGNNFSKVMASKAEGGAFNRPDQFGRQ